MSDLILPFFHTLTYGIVVIIRKRKKEMRSGLFNNEAVGKTEVDGFVKVCEGTAAVLYPSSLLSPRTGHPQTPMPATRRRRWVR